MPGLQPLAACARQAARHPRGLLRSSAGCVRLPRAARQLHAAGEEARWPHAGQLQVQALLRPCVVACGPVSGAQGFHASRPCWRQRPSARRSSRGEGLGPADDGSDTQLQSTLTSFGQRAGAYLRSSFLLGTHRPDCLGCFRRCGLAVRSCANVYAHCAHLQSACSIHLSRSLTSALNPPTGGFLHIQLAKSRSFKVDLQ